MKTTQNLYRNLGILFFATLGLSTLLALAGCKKDAPTPPDLLTGGDVKTWKIAAFKQNNVLGDTSDTDVKKYRISYAKTGTWTAQWPSLSITQTGDWALKDYATKFYFRTQKNDGSYSDPVEAEVRQLTSDVFHIKYLQNGSSWEYVYHPAP